MKTVIRGFIPVRKRKASGNEFGVSHEFNTRREEAELYARTDFDKENPVDRIAPCTLIIETVKNEW